MRTDPEVTDKEATRDPFVIQVPGIFTSLWYASYIENTAVMANIAIAVVNYREGEKMHWATKK